MKKQKESGTWPGLLVLSLVGATLIGYLCGSLMGFLIGTTVSWERIDSKTSIEVIE